MDRYIPLRYRNGGLSVRGLEDVKTPVDADDQQQRDRLNNEDISFGDHWWAPYHDDRLAMQTALLIGLVIGVMIGALGLVFAVLMWVGDRS